MRYKVLDYLYKQGGLTLFAFKGESDYPLETLQNTALALNAGAGFVILDFSGKLWHQAKAPLSTRDILSKNLEKQEIDQLKKDGWIVSGQRVFPASDEEFRNLYHNLHLLQDAIPHIIGILPDEISKEEASYIPLITRLLVITGNNTQNAAALVQDQPSLQKTNILWLFETKPDRKRYPKAYKTISRGDSFANECRALLTQKCSWRNNPEKLAKVIESLHRIKILEKNPLDGLPRIFKKFFIPTLLIAIFIPFLFVTKLEPTVSNARNRIHERDVITVAPFFEFTFDGSETMYRIAKYGIGRFGAQLATEKMIRQYIDATLEENGLKNMPWANGSMVIPPAGTVIKFSRPEFLENATADSDSIGAAWKYWTSIYSDSIAYITEFYHEEQTSTDRKHPAIDVAGKQGARILAPFSAKAWTSKSDRGGIIIGLVHEKMVTIFMHCDKLLYLDGQEVMAGDPIATVGTTGHTTGPHAHIVTGIVDKNGPKRFGNVRYRVVDPIQWYYTFKPKTPK